MLVKGVMKREVSVIGPDVWLALAACMMPDQDVGCLPVVENGRLIGMITDRDIVVRGVACRRRSRRTTLYPPLSPGSSRTAAWPAGRMPPTCRSSSGTAEAAGRSRGVLTAVQGERR